MNLAKQLLSSLTSSRPLHITGVAFMVAICTSSCVDNEGDRKLAVLTTDEVIDITVNSATSGGNVSSDGASVTARGVCWSTNPIPTTDDEKTNDGSGSGWFVSLLTGLEPNTFYYVRAYATNVNGTAYGLAHSF